MFSRVEAYAALGYDACRTGRCWIDILVVGLHAVQLDLFDALATSSGGSVVSGYSLADEVVDAAMRHCLGLPAQAFPPHVASLIHHNHNHNHNLSESQRLHSDGTIYFEVRTSRGVMPETIFGSVVMQNQSDAAADWAPGLSADWRSGGSSSGSSGGGGDSLSCCVDRHHVANMVHMSMSGEGESAVTDQHQHQSSETEGVYTELCQACNSSEYVASCALLRADPDFAVSFLLHPNETLASGDGAVVQMVLRWCAVVNTRHGSGSGGGGGSNMNEHGSSGNSSSSGNISGGGGGEVCQMTRILTFKLPLTADKKTFLAAVDVDLWTSMAARAISGDLHASSDGLGLPKALKDTDKRDPLAELLSSHDGNFINLINESVGCFLLIYD